MEIKEIQSKESWEQFLLTCNEKTFLHSWNWGEFQISLGNTVWRLGIVENGNMMAVASVIKHIARRGSFLLVPHGPIENEKFKNQKSDIIKILLEKLKLLAKEEKVDFIRVSPIWERTEETTQYFQKLGFRLRPLHTHPESSWKLDITPTNDELLKHMRKTTRYLIKQAENMKDLEVFQSFDIKDIDIFNQMHLQVVKNQKFVPFSLEYFKKEFQAFSFDRQIALFFAKYQGQIIAASYGVFWSEMAFYHHAALLPQHKKIPAAYLLQWRAIQEAKERHCKTYDFWGYSDPIKYPKHPYSGPTLFKMGFGGKKYEYVKTHDYIISPKYWINYILETARRIKRGL